MVHGANNYIFKGLNKDRPYFSTIEILGENSISDRNAVGVVVVVVVVVVVK